MNPEFKRILWLDSTPFRQFIMPSAVLLLMYLFLQSTAENLTTMTVVSFLLLMVFWGARSVSEAMMDEITYHTWDFQRMSAMGAWRMTWGKLLGASVYPWLSSCIILVVYIASVSDHYAPETWLKSTLILITVAWFSLAFALLNTVFLIRKGATSSSRPATVIYIIFGLYLISFVAGLLIGNANSTIQWYGVHITGLDFILYSSIAFTLWTVIGAYRLMRQALQYQNSPLVWLAFVLFLLAYWQGFSAIDLPEIFEQRGVRTSTTPLFLLAVLLTWMAAYISDNSLMRMRRIVLAITHKRVFETVQKLPLWFVSYSILLLLGIHWATQSTHINTQLIIVMSLLFVLRDILIVVFFNINNHSGRPDGSALLITLILYVLFPMILNAVNAFPLAYLFLPIPDQQWLHSIPALLQVMVMSILVIITYRAQWRMAEG